MTAFCAAALLVAHRVGEIGPDRALMHASIGVRLAAIDSLGRAGTADAVPALRHVEEQMKFEGEHVRAVNAAIASIQSRLLAADHGQLALAQPAGEVSLTDTEAGRVSLPSGGGRVPPEP